MIAPAPVICTLPLEYIVYFFIHAGSIYFNACFTDAIHRFYTWATAASRCTGNTVSMINCPGRIICFAPGVYILLCLDHSAVMWVITSWRSEILPLRYSIQI